MKSASLTATSDALVKGTYGFFIGASSNSEGAFRDCPLGTRRGLSDHLHCGAYPRCRLHRCHGSMQPGWEDPLTGSLSLIAIFLPGRRGACIPFFLKHVPALLGERVL